MTLTLRSEVMARYHGGVDQGSWERLEFLETFFNVAKFNLQDKIRVHICISVSNYLPLLILLLRSYRYVYQNESSHYRPCNSEKSKSVRLWSEGNEEVGGSEKDEYIASELWQSKRRTVKKKYILHYHYQSSYGCCCSSYTVCLVLVYGVVIY